ncbi:hypothetical protein SEMRO_2616_G332750.1 [Seminavis robusta]|uniref:Uncharacterized protein n=1 Tax=Seminavis robusta TaxID=568900 RepID=A0A9N8HXX8_9STRA|nr:hypothetical protein SEMRO_2616_G332750.1 [Seminavis robusta]|eukprot:Sro2616_g332750.1 n/a (369) ;mRNA; r:11746-12984
MVQHLRTHYYQDSQGTPVLRPTAAIEPPSSLAAAQRFKLFKPSCNCHVEKARALIPGPTLGPRPGQQGIPSAIDHISQAFFHYLCPLLNQQDPYALSISTEELFSDKVGIRVGYVSVPNTPHGASVLFLCTSTPGVFAAIMAAVNLGEAKKIPLPLQLMRQHSSLKLPTWHTSPTTLTRRPLSIQHHIFVGAGGSLFFEGDIPELEWDASGEVDSVVGKCKLDDGFDITVKVGGVFVMGVGVDASEAASGEAATMFLIGSIGVEVVGGCGGRGLLGWWCGGVHVSWVHARGLGNDLVGSIGAGVSGDVGGRSEGQFRGGSCPGCSRFAVGGDGSVAFGWGRHLVCSKEDVGDDCFGGGVEFKGIVFVQ